MLIPPHLFKVAIVGRPNVGKSSLFNRLLGRRHAIVDDVPGVTRDRQYQVADWCGKHFVLIDTGGFVEGASTLSLEKQIQEQVKFALCEADAILFVVDGRVGLTSADEAVVGLLRRQNKPVFLAVNKLDLAQHETQVDDFHRLGFKHTFTVSAETSRGLSDLLQALTERVAAEGVTPAGDEKAVRLAILGRPNVGKSTLLNAMLGAPVAISHPKAGTTRDPLTQSVFRGLCRFEFVDTAGIRKKSQTRDKVEKISVIKALQAADKADLALLVVDATEGVTSQDVKIASYAEERGKAMLWVINKWDLMPPGSKIKIFKENLDRHYKRYDYIEAIAISAQNRRGMKPLYAKIEELHGRSLFRVGTGGLNRVLQQAVLAHAPPSSGGKSAQIFYATQSQSSPPQFVLFCKRPQLIQTSYLRYLEAVFRREFPLQGVPLRWVLRHKNR